MEIVLYILLGYVCHIFIGRYLNLYLIKYHDWRIKEYSLWFTPVIGFIILFIVSIIKTLEWIYDEIQWKWRETNFKEKFLIRWFLGDHWNK